MADCEWETIGADKDRTIYRCVHCEQPPVASRQLPEKLKRGCLAVGRNESESDNGGTMGEHGIKRLLACLACPDGHWDSEKRFCPMFVSSPCQMVGLWSDKFRRVCKHWPERERN